MVKPLGFKEGIQIRVSARASLDAAGLSFTRVKICPIALT